MRINIKSRLDDLGITRYELAKRIGVTYPTITAIYNGNSTSIKLEILEALCVELDCTPNDILDCSDITIKKEIIKTIKKKPLVSNKYDEIIYSSNNRSEQRLLAERLAMAIDPEKRKYDNIRRKSTKSKIALKK